MIKKIYVLYRITFQKIKVACHTEKAIDLRIIAQIIEAASG